MMKAAKVALFILSAFIIALVMNVASIPADQYSIATISRKEFEQIKTPFVAFAQTNSEHGISYAGDIGSDTFSLYCKKVPLVILSNGPGAMYMLVFVDQSRRAPGLTDVVENTLEQMRELGSISKKIGSKQVKSIDAFVLKYRDGIDIQLKCNKRP